jgi:hypothetical protein
MSSRITDPTPSLQRLVKEYFFWNDGKNPYLITCTSNIYRLTKLETFLVRFKLLSVKAIDRYQTRLARFNAVKNRVKNKIKKKAHIEPFFWNDPKTRKPILFTSVGVVYNLSLFDRLMLKLGKINIYDIDRKAVGWYTSYSEKDGQYHSFYTGCLTVGSYEEYYRK